MPDFTYEALARTGAKSTGTLTANSEREAALDARRPRAVPGQDRPRARRRRPAAGGFASAGASRAGTSRPSTRSSPTCCTPACRCCGRSNSSNGRAPTRRSSRCSATSARSVADGTGLAAGDGPPPEGVQRTRRQHGPRRPGGRLPRRRAQAHRRLRRAPGRPEGEGDRRAGLPGVPRRRRRSWC